MNVTVCSKSCQNVIFPSLVREKQLHVVLVCILLVISEVENLFIYLLAGFLHFYRVPMRAVVCVCVCVCVCVAGVGGRV